jgi:hypothetical protein
MATIDSGGSLADLFGGLASDLTGLFRKEIELAKAEAGEKIDEAMKAGRTLAIGAVLAIGAIGVFLAALVTGLTAILVAAGMAPGLANFVSALAITAIVGGVGWAMISRALNEFRTNRMNMNRTAHSLQMDAAALKETI